MAVVMLFAMVPVAAIAQDETTDQTETTQTDRAERFQNARDAIRDRVDASRAEVREALDEAKKTRIAERCESAKVKIAAHLKRVTVFKDKNSAIYLRAISRVNDFIKRLDGTDVDISKLAANMEILAQKVVQAGTDLATYEALLVSASSFECSAETSEEFYTLIQDARDAHTIVVASIEDAKTFVTDVIKVDLQDIREQIANSQSDGGET